jgi:hypothetical protein
MRLVLIGVVALASIPGCSPSHGGRAAGDPGGGDPSGDTDLGDPGGDGAGDPGAGGTLPEFAVCASAGDCLAGLTCTPWPTQTSTRSLCLQKCLLQDGCGRADRRCVTGDTADFYARCLARVDHFNPCDLPYDTCTDDAMCLGFSPLAPPRCLPICELGASWDGSFLRTYNDVVGVCPPLGLSLQATAPACTSVSGIADARLCVSTVAVGELCDEAGLRCNPDHTRPDTLGTYDPDPVSGYDLGTLYCLQHGDAPRCERVCSNTGYAGPYAPCACPALESSAGLCQVIGDPGVSLAPYYACQPMPSQPPDIWGCMPIEDCSGDNSLACADNDWSGMTACYPNPSPGVTPADYCQLP